MGGSGDATAAPPPPPPPTASRAPRRRRPRLHRPPPAHFGSCTAVRPLRPRVRAARRVHPRDRGHRRMRLHTCAQAQTSKAAREKSRPRRSMRKLVRDRSRDRIFDGASVRRLICRIAWARWAPPRPFPWRGGMSEGVACCAKSQGGRKRGSPRGAICVTQKWHTHLAFHNIEIAVSRATSALRRQN